MFLFILSLWAGSFYLLNKIFFALSEQYPTDSINNKKWRKWSWITYVIGLPGWLIYFTLKHNWIVFAVESTGLVSMIFGLVMIASNEGKKIKILNTVSIIAVIIGLGFSVYDFGGVLELTQFLELGTAVGFLIGTYLLAKKRPVGYIYFMLMNICCGLLMITQSNYILAIQQATSLIIVIYAYMTSCKKKEKNLNLIKE